MSDIMKELFEKRKKELIAEAMRKGYFLFVGKRIMLMNKNFSKEFNTLAEVKEFLDKQ